MNGNETGRAMQDAREMTAEIDRITEAEVERLERQAQLGRQAQTSMISDRNEADRNQFGMSRPQFGMDREQAGSLGSQVLTYRHDGADQALNYNSANGTDQALTYSFPNETGQVLTYNPNTSMTQQEAETIQQQAEAIQNETGVIQSNEQIRRIAEVEEGYTEAAEHGTSTAGAETAVLAKEWLKEDREDIENEQGFNGIYVKKIMDRNNKRITNETVATVDRIITDKVYHPGELDEIANKARTDFLKNVFNRILGSRN